MSQFYGISPFFAPPHTLNYYGSSVPVLVDDMTAHPVGIMQMKQFSEMLISTSLQFLTYPHKGPSLLNTLASFFAVLRFDPMNFVFREEDILKWLQFRSGPALIILDYFFCSFMTL